MRIEELDDVSDELFEDSDLPGNAQETWFPPDEDHEDADDHYDACKKKVMDGKIGEVVSPEGSKFTHERARRPIKGAEYRTVKQKTGTLVRLMKVTKGPQAGKWVAQSILKPKKDSEDRADVYDLVDALPAFKKTPEGYLKGTAIVTNIGVFEYRDSNGTIRRELRTPEEVFNPTHIDSLKNKPITFMHPSESVDVKNFREYAVGMTGSVVQTDPYHLAVDLVITDAATIDAINKGTRALSLGYKCTQVKADAGARYLGVPYDFIQKDMYVNHLSIVDKARAGDAAYIRMDSAEAAKLDSSTEEVGVDEKMRTINLDGVDYKAEDKVIDALKGSNTRADELQTKFDALTAEKSALEAERDKQKERADGLATELDALKSNHIDASKLPELVKARVALEKVAEKVGIEKFDSLTDSEIMSAVVKAKAPNANLEGKDSVYIKARFDGIVEDMAVEVVKQDDAANRAVKGRVDSVDETSADAKRKAMIDRLTGRSK